MRESVRSDSEAKPRPEGAPRETPLEEICEAIRGLKFGSVVIIVQDGVVVQIDRTEKRRLRR
jgi:hypothetical protein